MVPYQSSDYGNKSTGNDEKVAVENAHQIKECVIPWDDLASLYP